MHNYYWWKLLCSVNWSGRSIFTLMKIYHHDISKCVFRQGRQGKMSEYIWKSVQILVRHLRGLAVCPGAISVANQGVRLGPYDQPPVTLSTGVNMVKLSLHLFWYMYYTRISMKTLNSFIEKCLGNLIFLLKTTYLKKFWQSACLVESFWSFLSEKLL